MPTLAEPKRRDGLQVVVEQRAEVHERLREADGASTVEHYVRCFASAVAVRLRRAERGLGLSPLAVRENVHQNAKEAKVIAHRVGRR